MSNAAIFNKVLNAKALSNFAPRLGMGRHRLALTKYRIKESEKGAGPLIEAEFVVLSSTTHDQYETRGLPWFISSKGWAGAYEESRAKEFLEACAKSIGTDKDVSVIGTELSGDTQPGRGLVLDVEITPQAGGKTNKNNEPYTNSVWKPVAQTMADLKTMRDKIDSGALVPVVSAKVESKISESKAASEPETKTEAPAPAAGGAGNSSLFGGLA